LLRRFTLLAAKAATVVHQKKYYLNYFCYIAPLNIS